MNTEGNSCLILNLHNTPTYVLPIINQLPLSYTTDKYWDNDLDHISCGMLSVHLGKRWYDTNSLFIKENYTWHICLKYYPEKKKVWNLITRFHKVQETKTKLVIKVQAMQKCEASKEGEIRCSRSKHLHKKWQTYGSVRFPL